MKREKLQIASGSDDKEIFRSINTVFEKVLFLLSNNNKSNKHLVSLTFFVKADKELFYDVRKYIILSAKANLSEVPAVCIIGQPPADGSLVLLEVEFIQNNESSINISYFEIQNDIFCTQIENSEYKELYFYGITIGNEKPTMAEKIQESFQILDNTLSAYGLGMNNIVRQWNYVEDIVGFTSHEEGEKQNYQILNNIRHNYYVKYEFSKGYPAATGIGMSSGGFVLDCIAILEKSDLRITPIKNPSQTSAYNYSKNVLIGSKMEKSFPKLSPKFERAKLYKVLKHRYSLLISGTAAIHNEDSLAIGDAGKQTEITLDNISKLVESASEILNEFGEQIDHISYPYLRVYIKYPEDFRAVEKICKEHKMRISPVYLISDICRKELLVEIEGVISITTK
jgi:enamine deaminase RidA (YjgF/YER057c/UK114 family)